MANKQGYTVLERYPVIDYAIVDRGENTYQRYVATWMLNEDDPDHIYWSQGHYFETLLEATKYVSDLLTGAGVNIEDLEAEFEDDDDIEDILDGDLEDVFARLMGDACGIIGDSDPWDDYDRDYTGINPY